MASYQSQLLFAARTASLQSLRGETRFRYRGDQLVYVLTAFAPRSEAQPNELSKLIKSLFYWTFAIVASVSGQALVYFLCFAPILLQEDEPS